MNYLSKIVSENLKKFWKNVDLRIHKEGEFPYEYGEWRIKENVVAVLGLRDDDGGLRHAVAVHGHWYFDSSLEHAILPNKEALDYSCQGGFGSICVAYEWEWKSPKSQKKNKTKSSRRMKTKQNKRKLKTIAEHDLKHGLG